ncbi:MAG: septum formation inhibitor Maf [Agathobacter sp.]|nr:septum formation inhibitor Maf [Agathobacter sp.]MBQ6811657.1 septum formation inhibitor Maf [Agathobacter sp.]
MSQIILASQSPRRKELLEQIGLEFEICPAKGEEIITKSIPEEVVMELSKQKAEEVAAMVSSFGENHKEITTPSDILVIGADTVVAYDGKILGKPVDEADAKRMLTMLSGNTHSVFTGVTLVLIDKSGRAGELVFFEKTDVKMHAMSELEIDRYIATGEPMDKAGSYGIQGKCAIYIEKIDGDYNNVVGLPISRIYQELKKIGIDLYLW